MTIQFWFLKYVIVNITGDLATDLLTLIFSLRYCYCYYIKIEGTDMLCKFQFSLNMPIGIHEGNKKSPLLLVSNLDYVYM